MSFTPSKRHLEPNHSEPNGRGKWRKTSATSRQAPLKAPPGAVVFRILCPASKCGSVIGKGGGIVTRIRKETGAKINLEDIVPGCEERVVIITGFEKDGEASSEPAKEENEDTGADDDVVEDDKGNEDKGNDDKDNVEISEEKDKGNDEIIEEKDDPSASEAPKPEKVMSSAQRALLLVFERIIGSESVNDGDEGSGVTVRLLIPSSQVACLLGKGGSVNKQMESGSGASIRVLPKDKTPSCASAHDEVVQITGGVDSAKKALQLVSQQLLENPSRDVFPAANPPGSSPHPFASLSRSEVHPSANFVPVHGPNRPYGGPDVRPPFQKFHEGVALGQIPGRPKQLTFRLLCSNDKVGSVIGKGGSVIKTLQHETGCEIKVLETTPESDDRIISISGPSLPDDRISPAQEGVLRVHQRIVTSVLDNKESVILSRLLISSNQTGCLLGKGGAVIAEMRKLSGAHIRLLTKDQRRNVQEIDEVVQISGEFGAVQEGLLQVTARLRTHLFREKVSAMNHAGHPAFVDQMPPFGSYVGRREPSPPRMFPNLPPFHRDAGGRLHDERASFAHAIHTSGILSHGTERFPPAPWLAQGMREVGGSMPISEYSGAPQRRMGFAGNQPAIITTTTVDVVVPRALVPSIYGEDGYCLRRIREISDAKITITEPRPEATETAIIIYGTPEQTHAAQSLLQAFVLSETGAP